MGAEEEATARESQNHLLAHRVPGLVVRILMHLAVEEWDMAVVEVIQDTVVVGHRVEA